MGGLGIVVIVLLTAGMLWSPTAASQPLGIHGDFTIDPGRRVGTVTLGVSRREVEDRLGTEVLEVPELWDWGIKAKMYWWVRHALQLAFCDNKLFAAMTFYASDSTHNWEWLNNRTGRMRLPEGIGMWSSVEEFDRLSPLVGIISNVVRAVSAAKWPARLYANGTLLITASDRGNRLSGIGVYNLDICRGGKLDDRPYIPFIGRSYQISYELGKARTFSQCTRGSGAAENPPRFGKDDAVCFWLTIRGYPPLREERWMTASRTYIRPNGTEVSLFPRSDGTVGPAEESLPFEVGMSEKTIFFYHGRSTDREAGSWKVQVYIKAGSYQVLVATIPYELAE